jgi:hypothetical protein
VLLGTCVFAWGLRYKLSLYDPPHAVSHHMAAARLLPGKERNSALPAPAPRLVKSVIPLAFSTLALVFLAFGAAAFSAQVRRSTPAHSRRRVAPARFLSPVSFVRPPPHLR